MTTVTHGRRGVDASLQGRVALVTGASGGIGREISLALAGTGATVALAYGSGSRRASELADTIAASGGRAAAFKADLARVDAPGRLVEEIEAALGPVDVLISNAGRASVHALEELSIEEFDQTIAINLRAPFLLAQRALPGMSERGFGRVLFVSSVAAYTGGIIGPHYAASKAGLHGLIHSLASRFAPAGVTVNGLAPALIADTAMLPGSPEELGPRIPVGRLGKPAEVADFALAILSNPYVTNQIVSIDGGAYPR